MARPEQFLVLVVEDSDEGTVSEGALRAGISSLLRAKSGDECLELLTGSAKLQPSLVLLDLNTPGIDGREALTRLRTDAQLSAFPIVVFSTSSDPRDCNFCYETGANAFHMKPVQHAQHLQLVVDLLTYWTERVELPHAQRV